MNGKTDASLIPLSREHHFALVLCLRIHRGAPKHSDNKGWLRKQGQKTIAFFEESLIPHFESEEVDLFPVLKYLPDASSLILELLNEHNELRDRSGVLNHHVQQEDTTAQQLPETLTGFADLLEQHIRKEERQLFPIYEKHIPADIDQRVGDAIFKRAGDAMQPKNPRHLT